MAWPTTDDPKTEFITVRLTVTEEALVAAAASNAGQNRSVYLRECVRRCVEADRRKALRLRGKEAPSG